MISGRVLSWFRAAVLTMAAAVGAICLLWSLGLALTGVRPLVFLSGSMAPAIETGDVGFATTRPADQINVGDIVSVVSDSGVRVTHRVVSAETSEGQTVLRLQGDANDSPDAATYTLTEADVVVGHVPALGRVLLYAASGWGLASGAALLAAAIVVYFAVPPAPKRAPRPRAKSARRPRAPSRVLVVGMVPVAALAGSVAAPADSTVAYFTDSPQLSTVTNGMDAAPWFTCEQSTSSQSYGSKPWAHLNFDENTGQPQTDWMTPYFLSTTDTQWDGIYYVGNTWNGVTPSTGHGQACRRDQGSRSVYLNGTAASPQWIRMQTGAQNANGAPPNAWNTFTVNVWFRTDLAAGDDKGGVLAAMSGATTTGVGPVDRVLYLDGAGRLVFEVWPGTHKYRSTSGNYADNQWHMATGSLGPAGLCLYLDSRPVGCDASVTSAYQPTGTYIWRFGHANIGNGFPGITNNSPEEWLHKGYLDDVAIWTRQLSGQEIRDMYRAGLPLR